MTDGVGQGPALRRVFGAALVTTAVVTALSYLLPAEHAATGVGLAFLVATYVLVLRDDDNEKVRRYGLSLGGLLESQPLAAKRLLSDGARALAHALALALVCFPPFWLGYVLWWQPQGGFRVPSWESFGSEALGQLLVIALPEEAFYRGYLLSALDERFPPGRRVFGARLGAGLLISSALFAVGHVLTDVHPNRLAVFFPALAFGWLRARTGGIGAATVFHALCNLFAAFVARGYD